MKITRAMKANEQQAWRPVQQTKDRRKTQREPTKRVSQTGMTPSLWTLEFLPSMAVNRLAKPIGELSQYALDQNLFFEPEVVMAAWPRLTSLLAPKGCWMMCLWETLNDETKLRVFMPVRKHRTQFSSQDVLQPLSNPFTPLGTPLIDTRCAGEASEILLRLLGDKSLDLPAVLDLTHQVQHSETLRTLIDAAKSLGLKGQTTQSHSRAALLPSKDNNTSPENWFSKKRVRELSRQLRRLEDEAPVRFETARTTNNLLDAFEHFISLELHGWKGRNATALYNHKRIAAFSRQIVAELAATNSCEILSLRHGEGENEKTIGSVILLGRNGRLMPWKMAFDESYAWASPGMLVMFELTKRLLQRDDFIFADSLAAPDHWMMNRLWPDRINIVDYTIAVTPEAQEKLKKVAKAKRLRAMLHKRAKSAQSKLRKAVRRIKR